MEIWLTGAYLHSISRWREYQSTEAIKKSESIDSVAAYIRECQRNDTAQPEIYVLNDDSDVD